MYESLPSCRVAILVKAQPQLSVTYGETVCCAGVTADGHLKRLYPVRFRHLNSEQSFGRWDWVDFQYRSQNEDKRPESCKVVEDTIQRTGKKISQRERTALLNRIVQPSGKAAGDAGMSLAVIRPRNTRFRWRTKSKSDIADEREQFRLAARQMSFFDSELESFEPTPYHFEFAFEDASGSHIYQNGDWEIHAMFYRALKRESSSDGALAWMDQKFNKEYPARGMMFCLGNVHRRQHTWMLLGVLRVDETKQSELFV